jgi:hypothetical protein
MKPYAVLLLRCLLKAAVATAIAERRTKGKRRNGKDMETLFGVLVS